MEWQSLSSILLLALVSFAASQSGSSCNNTPSGEAGLCTTIRQCPSLARLLQQIRQGTAPPGAIGILQTSRCSFLGNEPLVCCPDSTSAPAPPPPPAPVPPPQPPRPPVTVNRPPVTVNRPPIRQPGPSSNVECGNRGLIDKIIDGEDAPLGAWPWMVVFRGTVDGRRTWFCGGVLVSDRYVLSAAHCFKDNSGVEVNFARIGEHTLSFNPDCSKGRCAPEPQDIEVDRVIRHPQYQRPCRECNDIALVRLRTPAVFHTGFVVPVCLPENPIADLGFSEEEFQNKVAWAAGYGTTARDFRISRRPDVLQQVQLPIQRLDFCGRLNQGYPDPRMTLCAGGERKDTCRGDSGGPLTLTNNVGTKTYVVGITSLGPRSCGATDTQGLYTSVVFYMDWIKRTIGS